MWFSVLATIVVVSVFFTICASIAKLLAFRTPTRDGDSIGNRLAGHGPNDEVVYRSLRERMADLLTRRRRDRSARDD